MHKKGSIILAASVLLLGICGVGCSNQSGSSSESEGGTAVIFPRADFALVGDTMPFFDEGKMNIFYLADQRDGRTGYHPFALYTTEDYTTYEDMGIVIPYGENGQAQDNALGTGCVIKDQNGLYHAFFTGHNDYRQPMEAIMHATSTDMLNWKKIPEDTFIANENYSTSDFRDPYVFFVPEENQYWMLVVTRTKETGVIVKYVSKDLSKWEDKGIFFSDDLGYGTNMECPTLLQYKGKWYLSFSDQWPDRVVHYRISESINGPFRIPENETFDSNGFYAGRMETDGENLYMVGWNGTKIDHDDENEYDWAGNMVVHQMRQREDGTLVPVPNEKLVANMKHKLNLKPVVMTDSVKSSGSGYQFGGEEYELLQFEAFEGSGRIEAEITGYKEGDKFGIAFAPDIDNVGTLNLLFNLEENTIEFYNTDRLMDGYPQSAVNFDFKNADSLKINVFTDGGVVCMYVNDEVVLTARMYRSSGTNWQLFSVNSAVKFENVGIYD